MHLDPFVLPRRGFLRISERVRQLLALQKDVTLPNIQRLGSNYGFFQYKVRTYCTRSLGRRDRDFFNCAQVIFTNNDGVLSLMCILFNG